MKYLAGMLFILALRADASWFFCRAALITYDKTDFIESAMWEGKRDGLFPPWAAMVANEVARDRRPFDLIQLNQRLGKKRFDLEAHTNRRGGMIASRDRFGRVRATDPGVSRSAIGSICAGDPARSFVANEILRMQPMLLKGIDRADLCNALKPETELTNVRWKPNPQRGSLLVFNTITGEISVVHPTGIEAQQIIIEVASRLEEIIQNRKMPLREHEFALCMQDYFIAMPFYRGSASIGRALFAGLYLKIFGKKIKWQADIDLIAMTQTPEAFAKKFVSENENH